MIPKFLIFSSLLLIASLLTSRAEEEDEQESYKNSFEEFRVMAKDLVRVARTQKERDLAYMTERIANAMSDKITNAMTEALRQKRDADEDPMKKLDVFFTSIKDGISHAFNNVSNSEFFKDASQKFKEMGDTISEAGKKLGTQLQSSASA